MFSSLTPDWRRDLRAPATRAEIISVFHRAWTIAMRSLEPGTRQLAGVIARI